MAQKIKLKLSAQQKKLIGIQVGCWLVYFSIVCIGTAINFPQQKISTLLGIFLLKIIVFYVLLAILYLVFNKRHWYKGLLLLLMLYLLAAPTAYVFLYRLMDSLGFHVNNDVPPLDWSFMGRMLRHYILLIVFAVGFFAFLKYREYKNKQIEAAGAAYKMKMYALRMEKELEKLNYDLLAKYNDPHFVNNIFNLFFAQLLEYSPHWAGLMASFSALTRYTYTHALKSTRKIVVEKEWEQVLSILALQQARFPDVSLPKPTMEGNFSGQCVLPMTFITPLENAFNYGDFGNPADALDVRLVLTDDYVEFICRNRIDPKARARTSSGTGLANLRRRSEIVFKDDFQLTTDENGQYFTFHIIIYQ